MTADETGTAPGWESEIVVGLVGPVGTDLETVERDLSERLVALGYVCESIRISELLKALSPGSPLPTSPEHHRLDAFMTAGNSLRQRLGRGDALALLAANKIHESRSPGAEPQPRRAHILRSLKHPDEVSTLRTIYGPGFFLVGVWAGRIERKAYLIDVKNIPESDADALIRRDDAERNAADTGDEELGQRTRDTFRLADVFVKQRERNELTRFVDLVFGDPFHTPTADEHGMYLAYASSLRSGDLSRQVGAVVLSAGGDVIATGANDAPKFGGGLYWPGAGDERDVVRGRDANELKRDEILKDLDGKLTPHMKSGTPPIRELIRGSALFDLTEFGRAVHAEMEALLSCSRNGISPRGGTLLTTTFPCHNCTKHLVAAGILRVVFIEPYPKSLAKDLHDDAIQVIGESEGAATSTGEEQRHVRFEQFSGVGPRRFFDLFSMSLSSGPVLIRKHEGVRSDWHPRVRVPMLPTSYIEREKAAAQSILSLVEVKT